MRFGGCSLEIQTKNASSCGPEIYCTCSSIIHKETQEKKSVAQ